MFLTRWLKNTRWNTNASVTTSLSLTSPRGTTAARNRNKGCGLFDRYAKHKGVSPSALTMILSLTIVAMFLVTATRIYSVSLASDTPKPHSVISPISLFSRASGSIQAIHVQRPRGHRYFDYWQDEEHDDYEPYPWKFMKRPSHSSEQEAPASGGSSSGLADPRMKGNEQGKGSDSPLDDESFGPTPASNERERNHDDEIVFNDPSPFYAQLRQSYESFFPPPGTLDDPHTAHGYEPNTERCLRAVQDLQTYTELQTHLSSRLPASNPNSDPADSSNLYYDIHDCPEEPPEGYPVEWNLVHEVLSEWPADDPELPASGTLHQGLCVFDLQLDYEGNLVKAINYRNAEVPFVVRGDPRVAQTVERWNVPHYLSALIGDEPQGTETSRSGKFTYWTGFGVDTKKYPMNGPEYQAPTEVTEMTFGEWIQLANVTDSQLLTPESPHYYFKVVGCTPGRIEEHAAHREENRYAVDNSCSVLAGNAQHVPYLADELPFYAQTKSSLYIKEPLSEMKGTKAVSKALNCRFGMKGVMATNHFDGERNFVTVLSGERRYVLAHPKQCGNMALFPFGHPSARHSAVDWAHPDLVSYPEFEKATGNEVVLQAGDSLFLPSLWFHYIVSMSMNVQCNTRSGMDERNVNVLNDSCGW